MRAWSKRRASAYLPPATKGFEPPSHHGGCGASGRLRILCLHDKNRNSLCMQKEVEKMLLSDAHLISNVVVEHLDSPHVAPPEEARDFAAFARFYGGSPRYWHRGEGQRLGQVDDWPLLEESLRFVMDHLKRTGPYDGLCGFGQGGDLAALLVMLAEEGEVLLQGSFKFVIAVSSVFPRRPTWRPRVPLRVPTCHVYETNGTSPASDFEHLVLHWDPDCREVIVHDEGHEMPRLQGRNLEAFSAFLGAFHAGEDWRPLGSCWAGRLALPVAVRAPPSSFRASRARSTPAARRLVVACFHDSQPGSCSPGLFDQLTAAILQDPDLACRVALDPPDLQRYIVLEDLQNTERPLCPWYEPSHVVSPLNAKAADEVVRCFLKHNLRRTPVLVVGVGIGAYIGLRYALALRDLRGLPSLLYVVRPPAVFTTPEAGSLGFCDVTCFVSDRDSGGERWRFEAATLGRYETQAFPAEEGDAGWTDLLAKSLRQRVPFIASPAW